MPFAVSLALAAYLEIAVHLQLAAQGTDFDLQSTEGLPVAAQEHPDPAQIQK